MIASSDRPPDSGAGEDAEGEEEVSDEINDVSEDAAEFRCLVPFPDSSHSFTHGFEAGMVWQRMVNNESPIENGAAYHTANREVFERMAAAQGYDVEFEPCHVDGRECDTWLLATFTKRRSRFSVVQGGAA